MMMGAVYVQFVVYSYVLTAAGKNVIFVFFQMLQASWYDPVTHYGKIQTRFNTLIRKLSPEEKRRCKGSNSTETAPTVDMEVQSTCTTWVVTPTKTKLNVCICMLNFWQGRIPGGCLSGMYTEKTKCFSML